MSGRLDVVGTGSMVVDVIHLVPRLIGAESKLLVHEAVRRHVGGVTLNHLGWARILGLRVGLFGRQAEDADGRLLRDGMDRLGIEREIDLGGSASSCADVFVGAEGERAIYMLRGATGELAPGDVETRFADMIRRAGIFTTEVSQVPLASVRRALEIAREAGARTVVDLDQPLAEAVPALGSEAELCSVLELADIIKPAEAALHGLAKSAEALAKRFGARVVAVTHGERGATVWCDEGSLAVEAYPARVLDTTGAGDAFLGGLVAGMHLGLDWKDAARLGNACGAACCEQVGAFPDDPEACRARIAERVEFDLPDFVSPAGSAVDHFAAIAADEVVRLAASLDRGALRRAAHAILEAERAGGRVHVTGVGKPEHVARYAASLLASTGTPATFLHGTEATHGSVGQLRGGDVVIAISHSGETAELLEAVRAARSLGARVVAVTGDARSSLAREADVVLDAPVGAEGGPLGLAPRASVLAQSLVLQALSVELQASKGLTREEYHRRHPAGSLGRRSATPSD